jgi:sugar lactone lactonase YvrE
MPFFPACPLRNAQLHHWSPSLLGTPEVKSRQRPWLLRPVAAVLVVLLGSGFSWASISLSFRGVSQVVNTGGNSLTAPAGIAVDTAGNIYIADTGNSQIVAINPQGVASVLSITLSPNLSSPAGVAVDGSGNLYIADTGNSRVVEVSSTGVDSVVSMGSVTLNGPRGVAVDKSGNLFIADTGNTQIVEVPSGGSAAVLNITGVIPTIPSGVGVDTTGKLYIADFGGNRIVTVAAGGTVGVTLTISGGVTLNTPSGVAVDNIGNVYIADTGNSRISEVDTSGNGDVLQTSEPTSITLSSPKGVAVDVFGAVYIADTNNNQTVVSDQRINPAIIAGTPSYSLNKTAVGFGHVQLGSASPVSLTLTFTIAATALGQVKVLTSGTQNLDFTATAGASSCTSGDSFTLCYVYVQFLPTAPGLRSGAVVLYDGATPANPMLTVPLYGFSDAPIAALSPNTGSVINTGGLATANPYEVALDGAGNMYVGVYSGSNVTKIPTGGGSASQVTLGTPGSRAVQNITGVALDGAGNLFIGDHQNSRILVVTPNGVVSVLSINGLSPALGFPVALAFDGAGNLYIADFTNGRVVEISTLVVAGATSSGKATVIATSPYSFSGSTLTGMTVDSQRNIYFAARTQNSSSIIKLTAAGVASALTIPNNITPAINNPQGVGVDAMGNVYIVDTTNRRIVKITTAGVASVLSISGLPNPANSLGPTLFGVTADPSGNLYISDWTNNRIVFVNVSGAVLTFASTKTGLTSSDSPKTATVTNLGNQALAIPADPTYTADFSQPTGAINQCLSSTSLTPGTACNVSVQFTPQSVGSLSAGITVADNSLNGDNSQQVSVSGTGTNPGDTTAVAVSTNPTSAAIGQPLTVTAAVTDTTSGHTATVPSGSVTFMDTVGSTTISLNGGSAVTLSAGAAVLTGVKLSGLGVHTITANYAGVSGSFLANSNTTTLTVSKDTGTIAGPATQPVQVKSGQSGSVDLTVTGPYSGVAVPSGSVAYTLLNSSSTSVASGTLTLTAGSTNSTASVPLASSLAAGTYTLSLTYGGDSIYAASATATTVQVVIAAADFALTSSSGSPTTATALPGGVAAYTLTFSPSGSATFPTAVTLTVSGAPPGAIATLTPQTLPAGTGSANVTLTVQLPNQTAALHSLDLFALQLAPLALGVLLLPFGGKIGRAAGKRRFGLRLLLLTFVGTCLLSLSGCGGRSSGFFGHQQQSYTLTVTATSGSISHSTNLTLTVQ